MNYRLLYDYLKQLLEISIQLSDLSHSDKISYEKAVELRQQHREAYEKWLFYKNLQATISSKRR